ncbi:hypothetical protein M0R45_003069 [Rubus argutus]|uniref:F-box domain-containing protein n=1 Tax=Rubus argutus TaxID=59490 RepID=A0AAW1YGV4_RUBAR
MWLMNLPVEILLEILKRLPVKSVCCLRCASKTLLDMVDSPLFVSLHSSSLIATNAVAEAPHIMLRLVRSYCGTTQTDLLSLTYGTHKGVNFISQRFCPSPTSTVTLYLLFSTTCFASRIHTEMKVAS